MWKKAVLTVAVITFATSMASAAPKGAAGRLDTSRACQQGRWLSPLQDLPTKVRHPKAGALEQKRLPQKASVRQQSIKQLKKSRVYPLRPSNRAFD